ncbi:MAG: hypothetical protein RLZZ156_1930 [Deinococcota bacterium]|jgi:steroid delta-isomerase-like uncharacterized protein
MTISEIIQAYYAAFNRQDIPAMLELLSDDVLHEISQGGSERGKDDFRLFLEHMNTSYAEQVFDLEIMTNQTRAAAEFRLEGRYLKTDGAFPEAHGQQYTLRVGAFFDLQDGKITRVSNHYNLNLWLEQIS